MSEKASSMMLTPCFYIICYLNCITPYCKIIFKILYDFQRKLGNNDLTIWDTLSRFIPWLFTFSVKMKVSFPQHRKSIWPGYLRDIVYSCFLRNNVRIFILAHILIKVMSRNDFGLRVKSFCGSAKNRYFSRFYNDWRNMFININKKNSFFIFFKMFLKHVKMG